MKTPLFSRPAIVQTSLKEDIAQVIAINNAISGNERKTLSQFIDLGKALWKIKKQCTERGQWGKVLEETGVSRQRASEAMRGAKCPAPDISKSNSVRDLLKLISEPADEIDEIQEREPGVEDEEEAQEEQAPEPPKTKPTHCSRCTRLGPVKDCAACKVIQEAAGKSKRTSKPTISSNKAGKVKFDWKAFEHKFRPIAQSPDELVRAYPKEKGCDEFKRAQAGLNEYLKAMEDWKRRLTGGGK